MDPEAVAAPVNGRLRVGFIGLGVMGSAMAQNVMAAGFPVAVRSRSPESEERLVRLGARAAETSRSLASQVDVLAILVPDTSDLEVVISGPDGVAEGAGTGLVVLAMGTYDPRAMPRLAAKLKRHGACFLDAPVSGGQAAAVAGTLSIMVGGDAQALETALPVLQAMGDRVVHIGAVGAGQVAKACNQLVVGSTIEAVAEALSLAHAAGVDPARVREAMLGGFASSRVLQEHGQRMLDGQFVPGGRAALHAKDARIVLATAAALGVPLPGFEPVAAALERLIELGYGDLDHSALIKLLGGLDAPSATSFLPGPRDGA